LSGLAHVSAPYSPGSGNSSVVETAYFQTGDILIAADLRNVSATGHYTAFPGNFDTVIAQFPFADNVVPEHTVLHAGRCL
jgi:hypothetical protein